MAGPVWLDVLVVCIYSFVERLNM